MIISAFKSGLFMNEACLFRVAKLDGCVRFTNPVTHIYKVPVELLSC